MRQWRVGTLSMGFVLIATGIILLFGQFNQFSIIRNILNWWPIILILLGVEILVYLKFAKTAEIPIKYDFLSIVFIVFLGIITLGLYGLTTTGILDYFSEQFLVKSYELPLAENRLEIPAEISKLKIVGTKDKIKIITGDSNEIVSFGTIGIKATNEEEAKNLLPDEFLKTYTVGSTLFLEFFDNETINNRTYGNYLKGITLILPRNLAMEFEDLNYNGVKIELDGLRNNWLINSQGSVDVLLQNSEDLELKTLVENASFLEGTIDWHDHETDVESLDSSQGGYYESSTKWGEGKYKLQIISGGKINIVKL